MIPSRGNSNVDLNVIDDGDGWLREIHARRNRVNPKAGFLTLIYIALVHILEPDADILINNEVFVGAAPFLKAANILGWAGLDIINPSWFCAGNSVGSAGVDISGRAVGGSGLITLFN
jgi:hypothetical protein